MCRTLAYRGLIGSIEHSLEDGVYHGKVKELRDLISYEGKTIADLRSDFRSAVDDYLESLEDICDARSHRSLSVPYASASAAMATLNS